MDECVCVCAYVCIYTVAQPRLPACVDVEGFNIDSDQTNQQTVCDYVQG